MMRLEAQLPTEEIISGAATQLNVMKQVLAIQLRGGFVVYP